MFSKDNLSFSIVDDDDDFDFDESIPVRNSRDIPSPKMTDIASGDGNSSANRRKEIFSKSNDAASTKLLDSDNENEEGPNLRELNHSQYTLGKLDESGDTHAGPSGRQPVSKSKLSQFDPNDDDTDSDSDGEAKKHVIPGEYDPKEYQDLQVSSEIKEMFQFITKYIPQNLSLDNKFKPFIPEFIPAVGDIDAFLKVIPPETDLNGKPYNSNDKALGLTVLDEPTTNQSDPALLHLQLRAATVHVSNTSNIVVKKVDNVERNAKVIDKWIKDITDLYRSKPSPVVKYTNPMPDLDDLMEEWPENTEKLLKLHGFPTHNLNCSLSMYIDLVCCLFNIPVYNKNKIQSLHVLFSLYAAIKNSQLYKASKLNEIAANTSANEPSNTTDQLILE